MNDGNVRTRTYGNQTGTNQDGNVRTRTYGNQTGTNLRAQRTSERGNETNQKGSQSNYSKSFGTGISRHESSIGDG